MTPAATAAPPADPDTGGRAAAGSPRRIPELAGLRAVAIALVVIYHIWFRRVSGGVDVFFLLSGFLITQSLVRAVARDGRVGFTAYYARVARRIFPPALLVLVGVVVATVLWLPQSRWRDTLADVVASAVYLVNWHLAGNAVDYLASQDAASPVQHYWSLAIQGQFYLIWPVLVAAAAALAARFAVRPRQALALLLGAVLVVSLGYSVHRTAADQTYTYFDTFARLWEFALGGLLLLLLPYLRPARAFALPLGWLALAALLACGAVFRGGDEFPGWAALWPTLAAAVLVVTAGAGGRLGADRLLRSGALRWLGSLSYALYLWHWPVLICYLSATDRATASLRGGLLVIACSLALAMVTRWLLEVRLPRTGFGQRSNRGGLALAAGCVAAVLATSGAWYGQMAWQQRQAALAAAVADGRDYPGAAHLATGGPLPERPYRPGPLAAGDDRAPVYDNGCHQNLRDSEAVACEFGPAAADRTIALVGGSHSAHWLPALLELADRHRWRIVSITKSSCRFEPRHPSREGRQERSCRQWNEHVLAKLGELRPDAVLTTSTTGQGGRDHTPDGYLTQWRRVAELDIPVLAIRDVAWHDSDIPECVEQHGPDARVCGADRAAHGLDRPATVESHRRVPDNIRFLDLTDYLCEPDFCPAVIGNVLVYHDAHHLSATYARTLAPFLAASIVEATGWPAVTPVAPPPSGRTSAPGPLDGSHPRSPPGR